MCEIPGYAGGLFNLIIAYPGGFLINPVLSKPKGMPMTTPDEAKAEAAKRCLLQAQRLGVDMAGLLSCGLSGLENQFLREAYGHLEKLITNLNGIHGVTREQNQAEPKPEKKREWGNIKL